MDWAREDEATLNAWAAAAQGGDESAKVSLLRQFDPLVRSTTAWLWRSIVRSRLTDLYERDDLLQETQRLFLELVSQHNPQRGRSFTPFIVTMLRWRARNLLTQAQRGRMPGPRFSIEHGAAAASLDRLSYATSPDTAAATAQRALLQDAMQHLSIRQRRLLYLRYWLDVPVPRLAAAWGISQQAIRQALQRAERRLRRLLTTDSSSTPGNTVQVGAGRANGALSADLLSRTRR